MVRKIRYKLVCDVFGCRNMATDEIVVGDGAVLLRVCEKCAESLRKDFNEIAKKEKKGGTENKTEQK